MRVCAGMGGMGCPSVCPHGLCLSRDSGCGSRRSSSEGSVGCGRSMPSAREAGPKAGPESPRVACAGHLEETIDDPTGSNFFHQTGHSATLLARRAAARGLRTVRTVRAPIPHAPRLLCSTSCPFCPVYCCHCCPYFLDCPCPFPLLVSRYLWVDSRPGAIQVQVQIQVRLEVRILLVAFGCAFACNLQPSVPGSVR